VASERITGEVELRRLYLVPPCESEHDGELTAFGVRQASALGDALGDVALRAVYSAPGRAAVDTATAIAQRHGLVVRRKPALGREPAGDASIRIVEAFDAIARAGSGRTSLVVVHVEAVRLILDHCAGSSQSRGADLDAASITEVALDEDLAGYSVERVGDVTHLPLRLEPGS
jgi:broad specificity phosphatase PhoE